MLNSFKKCEKLFFYKYIFGIPEYGFLKPPMADSRKPPVADSHKANTALDPAEKGNIIHEVLENWTDYSKDAEPILNNVINKIIRA